MPKIPTISKLFRALVHDDLATAKTVAEEIALEEEKIGHHKAAQMLKGILRGNGNGFISEPKPLTFSQNGQNGLSSALTRVTEKINLTEVMLRPDSKVELEAVIKEWKYRRKLETKGLRARNKLFFYGPPGCGKSYCAKALGNELGIPVFIIRFDAVIGSYLGQTAVHIRELFRFAEGNQCILLFDEIDALGKQRGNPLDVGELDRIVIALMQELEHTNPRGMIIATSNLPTHLDNALWRRFDFVVEFPRPNKKELDKYATSIAKAYGLKLSTRIREIISKAKSYAEAEKIIETQARKAILKEL